MALIGELTIFSVHFTDAAGADADPTTVRLYVREEVDDTELGWLYNATPVVVTHYPTGMNPIVKDSVGDYHLNFLNRKAERLTGVWVGSGAVAQSKVETFLIRHSPVDDQGP